MLTRKLLAGAPVEWPDGIEELARVLGGASRDGMPPATIAYARRALRRALSHLSADEAAALGINTPTTNEDLALLGRRALYGLPGSPRWKRRHELSKWAAGLPVEDQRQLGLIGRGAATDQALDRIESLIRILGTAPRLADHQGEAAPLRALLPFAVSAIVEMAPYCDAHECTRLGRWEWPEGAATALAGCAEHKHPGAVESEWARALRVAAEAFGDPESEPDPLFAEVLARARGGL